MAHVARLSSALLSACVVLSLAACSSAPSSSSSGGGTGGTTGGTTAPLNALATGGASSVYVLQQASTTSGSVLQFSASSSGIVSPAATLGTVSSFTQALALDASGNIYVGSGVPGASSGTEIQVYPSGATQTTAAIRTITGTTANPLPLPWSLAVDNSGQLYVLTNIGTIYVYASGATGPVDPIKVLSGALTQIVTPLDIAVDSAKNIYVATATVGTTGAILVFSSSASGNVAPARVITSPNLFFNIAVDSSMDLYATINTIGTITTSVVEYAPTANGAASPTKTISGSSTGFTSVYASGLRLDAANNLWVSVDTPVAGGNNRSASTVEAFGPNSTGNLAPALSFTSTAWTAGGTELAVK